MERYLDLFRIEKIYKIILITVINMKSHEVLRLLGVTRVTLTSYVKSGKIKATMLDNGHYDYNAESVFAFLKKDCRYNVIYARVSTYKQKNDLKTQIKNINKFCLANDITIEKTFSEISSGIDLDRKELSKLLDEILAYKVKNVYITNRDRLTRLSFVTIESICKKFGTNIVVINKNKEYDNELFEELLSLIHIFSTKMYSHRRHKIDIPI